MPRLRLQGRRASPFSLHFHHDFAAGERLKNIDHLPTPAADGSGDKRPREKLGFKGHFRGWELQKQRLFRRFVDLSRKCEGAAIDFFRTQEANVLWGKPWRGGLLRFPALLEQCHREQKYDGR